MTDRIIHLISLIQLGQIPKDEAEALLIDIRKAIKDDPSKGKELGQYIGLISNAIKSQPHATGINWLPADNGYIAIGHKPGGKISFEGLKNEGTTAIVTLLHENEGAQQIGTQTKQAGMAWVWFPFSASKPHAQYDTIKVLQLFNQLHLLLKSGGKIYIHCSAGIHRTGMIAYGLLRYLGYGKIDALQMLSGLREVTAAQAGENRLQWGDQFATDSEKGKVSISFADCYEDKPVDYFSYDAGTWPYLSEDDYIIYGYFQIWVHSLRPLFPEHDFLLDENRGIPNYRYNFFSLVVKEKGAETSYNAIVFMINKNVPLAVWGTVIDKTSGWDDEWYLLPKNLYLNTMGSNYSAAISRLVTDLVGMGLHFAPLDILLRRPLLTPEERACWCIDVNGSLDTLYGCSYNIYES
jgi:hypothetical protein